MMKQPLTQQRRPVGSPARKGILLALAAGFGGALIVLGVGGEQPDLGEVIGILGSVAVAVSAVAKLVFYPTVKGGDDVG